MNATPDPTVALLYPGDRATRDRADPAASRFAPLFEAFAAAGVAAVPAVYHDDFAAEVEAQLQAVRAVLVWHNPIEGGRTRRVLDAMLQRVADRGVFVSAHPDTVLRLGTKDVLVDVRDLPFGCDAHRVGSLAQLQAELPPRLVQGARVLKQHRGHSGIGVWRVERLGADLFALRHAMRGAAEERLPFAQVLDRLAPYFEEGGHMVDQAWQPRLAEGMVRAYLVQGRVAGFGHQAVTPPLLVGYVAAPPPPGPRLYSDAEDPRFQGLRQKLEGGWVTLLTQRLGVAADRLPLLWDADFMFGEGEGAWVLCEINVSSVAPYPESANAPLVRAVQALLSR